jgi:hypothetical protein
MRGQQTHLDPEVLAEFRAGLVTGHRGAKIAAHLAGCDRCTALGDELAGVSALFATVPAPAMPDQVAQRLDTALIAEVANRDSERAYGASSRDRETRARPARNGGFRLLALRVLAPAAVVLLAAGGYGLSRIGSGPTMQGASSAASAQAASGARAPVAAPVSKGPAARAQRMTPLEFTVVTSSADFQPATLKQQIEAALRVRTAGTTQAPSAAVRACVQGLVGTASPVLVERARFGGRPATVIVAPTGRSDQVWVAGPRCSATTRDVLAATTVPSGIS